MSKQFWYFFFWAVLAVSVANYFGLVGASFQWFGKLLSTEALIR
jgi:hypothetical protein